MKKLLLILSLFCSQAFAAWPEKDITIIVPYPPGGANDRIARQLSISMEAILKRNVNILNVAGGGNALAINEMERMDPDYTFMLPNGEIITGPASQGKDSYKNFHPVSIFATAPQMVYANPAVTRAEFVASARRGDELKVAVPDLANPATIWLDNVKPLKVIKVPYKGGAQTVFAVTAKQVDYGVGTIANGWGALTQNQIVPIMIGDSKRSPLLPDVPTYLELGFKGKPNVLWFGLIALNRINPKVEERVATITEFAVNTDGMRKLSETGLEIRPRNQKDSQKIYQHDIDNLSK